MTEYVCILTDEVLASIGAAPECANCTDASWWYRGEQPIVNGKGIKFCSVDCADEAETRWEREEAWRASDWCAECGFDNHEHQDWCSTAVTTSSTRRGRLPVVDAATPAASPGGPGGDRVTSAVDTVTPNNETSGR